MNSFLWTVYFLGLPLLVSSLNPWSCKEPVGVVKAMLVGESFSRYGNSLKFLHLKKRNPNETQGMAGCFLSSPNTEHSEWLQVDFHTEHMIRGMLINTIDANEQRHIDLGSYEVIYYRPEVNTWNHYEDRFSNTVLFGNSNRHNISKTVLCPPLIASKLKVFLRLSAPIPICIRVQAYGFGFAEILSYSMPEGSEYGNWSFLDNLYDGFVEGNLMKNGLGQLTDGREGSQNFKNYLSYPARDRRWVGWRLGTGSKIKNPIQIVFKFQGRREFLAVKIHTCNQFRSGVKMFREARAEFSQDNETFEEEAIIKYVEENNDSETPTNITMQLKMKVGRFVRLSFYFASDWILISEIYFESRSLGTEENGESINSNQSTTVHMSGTTPETNEEPQYIPPCNPGVHEKTTNDGKLADNLEWMLKFLLFLSATAVVLTLLKPVYSFVVRKQRIRTDPV